MATTSIAARDGPAAIQDILTDSNAGDTIEVTGSGSYTWPRDIRVPNNRTLHVADDVSVMVPRNHSLRPQRTGTRDVYSLISCADRVDPRNVTIRGGSYDMSAMREQAGYAGVWLHNARDSLIDDVTMTGGGYAIRDNRTYRGFGLALTNATQCKIRDSESYNSAYDDIAVRGACRDCDVVRSGGRGGTSGTIQTARWGHWGLRGYPQGTTFEDCWGRRIYCHDGRDTVWDGCASPYRLQTIGAENPVIKNSRDFEGYVLLYTYDSGSARSRIENMEFSGAGSNANAIEIGPNGPNHGTVTIDRCTGERQRFVRFTHYSRGGSIGEIRMTNSGFRGQGRNSAIVSPAANAPSPKILRLEDCVFVNFDSGITGRYDEVHVHNCAFHGVSGPPINVRANVVDTSNITTTNRTDVPIEHPRGPGTGSSSPSLYDDYLQLQRGRQRATAQQLGIAKERLRALRQ